MNDSLQNKRVFITGASSGIGECTAEALVTAGAQVVLLARRADRLEALTERLTRQGGKVLTLVADVSDEAQVRQAFERVQAEWGGLDCLINNAGVMLLGAVEGANTDQWRQMVNTNVLGLLYCTHAAIPLLKRSSKGHIINLSSVAGRTARANAAVYNATKWGVCGFSEALRQEMHKFRIRVTLIEPGAVDTELLDHNTDPKLMALLQQRYSYEKLQSADIAASILYAMSQPDRVNVNEILIRPIEQEF